MTEEPYAPRTVKPRSRKYKRLPVVALDSHSCLFENGEIRDISDVCLSLQDHQPTLFAMVGSADFLSELDEHYHALHPKSWQYRATSNERGIIRPDGMKVAARVTVAVHFFGFKPGNFHKLIDPVTMYGHKLDDIWPGDQPHLQRLLAWAVHIRDFCADNQMDVRPTIGAISAQFLTDPRFYPDKRRKVPRQINQRAREELPGNHYALAVTPTPKHEYTAWYLDQHQAHHYHAQHTPLPSSNSLYAYGSFLRLKSDDIVWDKPAEGFYGLYCLDLCAPPKHIPFDWISHKTKAWHDGINFVFSNELQHVLDMGYTINGVRAAWGSFERDTGLALYAQFAGEQLDRYDNQPWIKPLLLATYGTLATRAGHGETIFRLAKRGTPVEVLTGRRTLPGILTRRPHKLEPGIANVIHRGMIEAGCRSESVGLAQHLEHLGFHVLSIYADAVIVRQDGDKNLPELFNPWRVKATLNHLQFLSKQAFMSGEMTKLPGVNRETLKYRQRATGHAPHKMMTEALTGYRTRHKTRRI